jgi:hypothetical protein
MGLISFISPDRYQDRKARIILTICPSSHTHNGETRKPAAEKRLSHSADIVWMERMSRTISESRENSCRLPVLVQHLNTCYIDSTNYRLLKIAR